MIWFTLLIVVIVILVSALTLVLIRMDNNKELFLVHWCSAKWSYADSPCPCPATGCHRPKVVPAPVRKILLGRYPQRANLVLPKH